MNTHINHPLTPAMQIANTSSGPRSSERDARNWAMDPMASPAVAKQAPPMMNVVGVVKQLEG